MGQKIPLSAAADKSGMHVRTLRRYVARNLLRAYKTPTGAIRIDVDDLDALFEDVTTTPAERDDVRRQNLVEARKKRWPAAGSNIGPA